MGNDRHACVNAIFGLSEIVSLWIAINICMYFVDSWQRMQYFDIGFGIFQHLIFQDIDILDLLIFNRINEPFFLNTSHIDDICLIDNIVKLKVFKITNSLVG